MKALKQSTAAVISFGPFLDKTDGVTLETGLVSALDHATTGIMLSKNGGALAVRNPTVTATTYDAHGCYRVTLDTTDTGTLGRLRIIYTDAATCLPVWDDFMVLPANVFDSLVSGADALQVHANEITAGLITAAAIATGALDADALAADAVTEIQSGLATAAALSTVDDFLDTEIAAILADTNELQTDWVDGGRLDLLVDAIKAKTDNLPADPADDSDIDAQLAIITAYIDTEIAAIKAKTDNLPPSPAATGDAMALTAAAVDEIWDEDVDLAHQTAGSAGKKLDDAGAAADPWATALPGAYGAGAAGKIVGDNLNATVSSRATPAQVNAEVVDALATDTYAEPGQEAPAATNTLAVKIAYLFKFLRNRTTQDATTLKVYADDAATVDQKAAVSDDATTYDRGEIGTGP